MRCLRVAACLAALIFSLSSLAMGAEVTYSGIPGKWKRGSKSAKDQAPEAEAPAKEAPKETGKKTKPGPGPKTAGSPGTPEKK